MQTITLAPIGVIHSPYKSTRDAPRQSDHNGDVPSRLEILPRYQTGLKDLEGFSHLLLIYHLHRSKGYSLTARPPHDRQIHGVFATRSPRRPNALAVSVVKLDKIEANIIHIKGLDAIEGTPLLDIKPFFPYQINPTTIKTGWRNENNSSRK